MVQRVVPNLESIVSKRDNLSALSVAADADSGTHNRELVDRDPHCDGPQDQGPTGGDAVQINRSAGLGKERSDVLDLAV
jgi:hypothetical protein